MRVTYHRTTHRHRNLALCQKYLFQLKVSPDESPTRDLGTGTLFPLDLPILSRSAKILDMEFEIWTDVLIQSKTRNMRSKSVEMSTRLHSNLAIVLDDVLHTKPNC